MKIYTLYYADTNLYNKQIFVLPNDETAKKAMKLQLMDAKNINFINEAKLGNTILKGLGYFSEEVGLTADEEYTVCNLKDLLNDDNKDLVEPKQDNT